MLVDIIIGWVGGWVDGQGCEMDYTMECVRGGLQLDGGLTLSHAACWVRSSGALPVTGGTFMRVARVGMELL